MAEDMLDPVPVEVGPNRLNALLGVPEEPVGLVIFAHGSGSGRLSPRNNHVAAALRRMGLATLLLDLLTRAEERDRANVFDIQLLATRLVEATDWAGAAARIDALPIGYFGSSTGAGAALAAAAHLGDRIGAVVSRGGRPDLAGPALAEVRAPTLLIVGSLDGPVIDMNNAAARHLQCVKEITIVEGAGHLFEEPGTLDEVIRHAGRWFLTHLSAEK
ncbi:alpha/beta hydrolase [Parasphingopyxis algicola]|nr:alpha/beta hydrolase [Parasphingopyxis algicola]